ncbi:adenylosuccinate synthetase [Novosphingobium beihaiensis]|uniref:Adenylosuccinate synthetase n=1 Tax=Novosphingobium beihaiensis TaxID=2930389 RepID=A0ABT0BKG5_9SPHN|nr:adenylosuccinate synthetase [Novosphingobium beihaiensis]MCJ2185219.1 adenylosuccinate synthetase [Novosphingobium beihaiensis]
MPVSVVVGGQYGSEGKGKVALDTVRRDTKSTLAVRPGGSNSGHTGFSSTGRRHVLRQLPAAVIDGRIGAVIPAGSYVDPDLLLREIVEIGISPAHIHIDPRAHVITNAHREWERQSTLTETIGSTGSGTGAAVLARAARYAPGIPRGIPAAECDQLRPFLSDTVALMRGALSRGERIVVEGTQGFGLSALHGDVWPKATSRDTTAAGFLSEAGLAPSDVDDVVLVLRSHPIRVAGDSGPLHGETSWDEIAQSSGGPWWGGELTSVTHRLRRVGKFDAEVVLRAIMINQPQRIVMNHLDHVDYKVANGKTLTDKACAFIADVQRQIGRRIDAIGTGEQAFIDISSADVHA